MLEVFPTVEQVSLSLLGIICSLKSFLRIGTWIEDPMVPPTTNPSDQRTRNANGKFIIIHFHASEKNDFNPIDVKNKTILTKVTAFTP